MLCGFCLNALGGKVSVPNVYIEAQGNNIFEAKIRADKGGIRQSINLFLDKIDIKSFDVKQLELQDLKNICQISRLENQNSEEFFYSATADYTCDSEKLRKAIAASQNIQKISNFYEVLVIPVLKKEGQYFLWDDAKLWHDRWQKHKNALNKDNIWLAEETQKIDSQNILRLNYQDIASIYPNKLFNKVAIIICDLFEKRGNTSHVHVKYKVLNEDSSTVEEEDYPELETALDGVRLTFDDIINAFHEQNGQMSFLKDLDLTQDLTQDQEQQLLEEKYDDKKYTLYIDGYDINYVEQIKKIIKKAPEITNANFTPEGISLWKVELWGEFNSDEEFAQSLYASGLTYRKAKDHLKLIKLDKGV